MLKFNDTIWIGNFSHGVFQTDSETEKGLSEAPNVDYLGGWLYFKKEGHGVRLTKDGFKFVGNFSSDKKQGSGVKITPDNRALVGEWSNGLLNGEVIVC